MGPEKLHHKRPGNSRRSSSDKSVNPSSKHGVKTSTHVKTRSSMPDSPSAGPSIPTGSERQHREEKAIEGSSSQAGSIVFKGTSTTTRIVPSGIAEGQNERIHDSAAEEVERLRAAMEAQMLLTQQREKVARKTGMQAESGPSISLPSGKSRISPIHEEMSSPSLEDAFASPLATAPETGSTDSVATVRGGMTPGLQSVRTPSYPFPPMKTPRNLSYTSHRPFTALSPTVNPSNYSGGNFDGGIYDRVQSGSVTPASTLNFRPQGMSEQMDDPVYETPNLYDLSLMLMSEPGLDSWWTTVAKIMKDLYKAERVTLTIPADPTDVENVPWAQKATFDSTDDDELSLNYLPRGSSLVPSSNGTNEGNQEDDNESSETSPMSPWQNLGPPRPTLESRHSFTAYEDTKREPSQPVAPIAPRGAAARPSLSARAKSYAPSHSNKPPRTATLQNAELSLQSLQHYMEYDDPTSPENWETKVSAGKEVRGRVFPVLQALEYEADPLIDNTGVMRVLDREKLVVLTRDYPYDEKSTSGESTGDSTGKHSQRSSSGKSKASSVDKTSKVKTPDLTSRLQKFFGGKVRHARNSTQEFAVPARYEEYEQGPPSPWSQSPAPSPAVRAETTENPFFANQTIDEESFDPAQTPKDYSQSSQLEAIGVDRSWTVLHVPLMHPLLSKPLHTFRLDTAALESRSGARGKAAENKVKFKEPEPVNERRTPVAILSLLSPVIPYPSNLRHSLEYLAPHLASSYTLCRHHSNLQTEIAGLSRKGPQQAGFGAVVSTTRLANENIDPSSTSPPGEISGEPSTGGSITSPSDYSGVSRSAGGSPAGTPGWEPGNVGGARDKKSSGGSPAYSAGESYFTPKTRPSVIRVDTGSASSIYGARRSSKDGSPTDTRFSQASKAHEDKRVNSEFVDSRTDDGVAKYEGETLRSSKHE
jgi:hypothetical protein